MFNKLREKLQSFLGKSPEKAEEPKKKPEKTEKPKKEETKKTEKIQKPTEKSIPKISKKQEKKESPKPTEAPEPQPSETTKKEILPEEEIKEAEKKTKEPSFFQKISKRFTTQTIKKEQVEELFEPIELILLENNVALEVVDKIHQRLEQDLTGMEIKKSEDFQALLKKSLKDSISNVLIEPPDLIKQIKSHSPPYTIIFFGINGSGKTTSLAKLANKLKKEKISCVLAAADTFRAASIEQLEKHSQALNLHVIKSKYGADPASVAFDAKAYAQKNKIQCVLIDTAGRMYTKSNLIREMEKIIRVSKPDLKLFVGESITGNDAIEQAKTFNEAIGIDGIILTKADVDEKGGTALSVSEVTNKPIYFLGTGQSYDSLEVFNKSKILKNLGLD